MSYHLIQSAMCIQAKVFSNIFILIFLEYISIQILQIDSTYSMYLKYVQLIKTGMHYVLTF